MLRHYLCSNRGAEMENTSTKTHLHVLFVRFCFVLFFYMKNAFTRTDTHNTLTFLSSFFCLFLFLVLPKR